jgi:hypothetical protein
VWNIISHPEGENQLEDIWEQDSEKYIETYKKASNRRLENDVRSFISCALHHTLLG